jgi:wyosine [tRNA(Phe)-imidazoG37] synthetase (radical SAM superfamily)
MTHIFGPVNSRRLGRSLGIDLFTDKVCNLNCIYCEVGPTVTLTCKRDHYVPVSEIIAEIEQFCSKPMQLEQIDVFTVTASGEPTLHSGLGAILAFLKKIATRKVIVLTNGTTLLDKSVREELQYADIVIPSLDSALLASFRKLNRPAACVRLEDVIEGLVRFSNEYTGEIWLEILLALGINDSAEDLQALSAVLPRLALDRVQLNTVVRPPLEKFALPVSDETLKRFAGTFSQFLPSIPVEIITSQSVVTENRNLCHCEEIVRMSADREIVLEEIINMLRRRPCTAVDINRTFRLGGPKKVEQYLEPLVRSGRLELRLHGEKYYYH